MNEVVTNPQLRQYVSDYSTYTIPVFSGFIESYTVNNGGKAEVYNIVDGVWVKEEVDTTISEQCDDLNVDSWTPTAGEYCEVKYPSGWYKVFVVGQDDDGDFVFTCPDHADESYDAFSNREFYRPLYTEKERVIEKAIKVLESLEYDDSCFASALYDLGMLKEGK